MVIRCMLSFLISLFSGILLIIFLKKLSLKYNILVLRQIPLIGGIAIWLSFLLGCLYKFYANIFLSREIIAIIVSSFAMLIFGIIDDWKELSVSAKLLFQIIAASLLISLGIRTHIAYIGNPANIIITIIWMIGITNAFNHIDIIDGLAAGVAIIISFSFLLISMLNNDFQLQAVSLLLIGSLVSFLVFNVASAKIYMGNSGSHL
jgi:UDP-GlcNAc:undecaprenyl-phosphate GlcNAc-1-phosphate transferase